MRRVALVLALFALAACAARTDSGSGPTLSLGGSVSAFGVLRR